MEQYRREFGADRALYDLPYYSDLSRFGSEPRSGRKTSQAKRRSCVRVRLFTRKGVDMLARAFLRLAAERTDVRLQVHGGWRNACPSSNGSCAPLRTGLSSSVSETGRICLAVYRAADVLCVPSRHDGWGLVVPEALAAGLPVIASDRTGAALELLRPRANGWLIPANDETALLAAMVDAARLSDEEMRACSMAAVASVSEHTLQDGVSHFLEAAEQSLASWSTARH